MQDVSLEQQADASQAQPVPAERKIIRDATLTLEVEEPVKAAERVASIAESRGGFVVSSESRHESGARGGDVRSLHRSDSRARRAVRRGAPRHSRDGGRVTAEKVSGKDVTEEYIDLEARLRTQRALEAQLLDIMKTAREVSDAISVQKELTNVRTEIERVEGRRRFLESQSSLSTINVTLQPPAPLVATTGFFHSIGEALGDGVDIAAAITLFLIRACAGAHPRRALPRAACILHPALPPATLGPSRADARGRVAGRAAAAAIALRRRAALYRVSRPLRSFRTSAFDFRTGRRTSRYATK
jgi:hypothetical protein